MLTNLDSNFLPNCLIQTPLNDSEHSLAIYARNRLANAERALAISFPTIALLLGEEGFRAATVLYLNHHPATTGDWGQWGEHFANCLAKQSDLNDFAYIADCARLDWSCHLAARTQDNLLQLDSLSLLADVDAYHLYLETQPALSIIASPYPLYEIWQAHHGSPTKRDEYLAQAQHQLADLKTTYLLIHRPHWQVQLTPLSHNEFLFWQALLSGQSLGVALDAVADTEFSVENWLSQAIQHQWINKFYSGDAL